LSLDEGLRMEMVSEFYIFLKNLLRDFKIGSREWPLVWEEIYSLGVKSIFLIFLTALATGMVMTLQFGMGLSRFGGVPYVPRLVSVSVLREMGPVFASLMMAARMGAGVTAQIGTMMVTQQFDAYWTLGSSPIRKVLAPKILAILIIVPILCAWANLVSLFGVYLTAVLSLNLDTPEILGKIAEGFTIENFSSGFFKTFFFALGIGLSACFFGSKVKGGSDEVGHATTRTVVTSSIGILIGDFILTRIFLWL